MVTIKEADLPHEEISACFFCAENEGDIFMCGEGYLCTQCFAQMSGVPEEEVFQNASQDEATRSKLRESIYESRKP